MMEDETGRDLTELYRANAVGMPPREIDEKIMRAARRELEKKSGRWVGLVAAAVVLGLLLAWRSVPVSAPIQARSAGLELYGYNEGRADAYLISQKFYGGPRSETADNLLTAGSPGLSPAETSQQ